MFNILHLFYISNDTWKNLQEMNGLQHINATNLQIWSKILL